ncbi:hypothetical protein BS47DRAFT_503791 [Hydnum rufescens UP504]|uniref:Uncharacterized protein n=1 Tax=Hydnum rufescens UP504 TaxID=1448309 RepID=A0A9P6B4U6_9AGAM|nr:hypothetical protein BS47DRAFT_503791 [Hydnum rufescens UP504]
MDHVRRRRSSAQDAIDDLYAITDSLRCRVVTIEARIAQLEAYQNQQAWMGVINPFAFGMPPYMGGAYLPPVGYPPGSPIEPQAHGDPPMPTDEGGRSPNQNPSPRPTKQTITLAPRRPMTAVIGVGILRMKTRRIEGQSDENGKLFRTTPPLDLEPTESDRIFCGGQRRGDTCV